QNQDTALNQTKYTFNTENRPVIGDPEKGVKVVEFFDYNCLYCAQFEVKQVPKIKRLLIDTGQMHLYLMHSPFIDESSTDAAIAAECVYQQSNDQFLKFHHQLMQERINHKKEKDWITPELLLATAKSAKVDIPTWKDCL